MTANNASPKPGLLILTPDIRDAVHIAKQAEQAGARGVWSIEYYNLNCVARLAAFASVTERVELGAGVLAAFSRAPAMTASVTVPIIRLLARALIHAIRMRSLGVRSLRLDLSG